MKTIITIALAGLALMLPVCHADIQVAGDWSGTAQVTKTANNKDTQTTENIDVTIDSSGKITASSQSSKNNTDSKCGITGTITEDNTFTLQKKCLNTGVLRKYTGNSLYIEKKKRLILNGSQSASGIQREIFITLTRK